MQVQPIATWSAAEESPPTIASPAQRANRRRVLVFAISFVVLLAASLAFVFSRPAEYRSVARLQITPATLPAGVAKDGVQGSIASEVQVLTSRPVLQSVAEQLQSEGYSLADLGSDAVSGIQARLRVTPVPNSEIVELAATGGDRQLLAPMVNGIVEAYRARVEDAYANNFEQAIESATQETERLAQAVNDKRHAVERFRTLHNIVSLDRDENQILARVRSQNAALNAATERLAAAETKLRDVNEAAAAGNAVTRPRDEAAISGLQQQITHTWQELSELDRRYTPEYLARDPNVKLTRARLADMEAQVAKLRQQSKEGALADAQAELASARAARQRLEAQIGNERGEVAQFTRYFNEYKAQQQELAQLEASYRDALQRKTSIEATEGARQPKIRSVETAVMPYDPWKPDYWRDAGIAAGGSLALALLLTLGVEWFNRTDPQPTLLITPRMGIDARTAAVPPQLSVVERAALLGQQTTALPAPEVLPRELASDEVVRLVHAADDATRRIVALIMSGMSEQELLALRWRDVDLEHRLIHVPGKGARDIPVNDELRALLGERSGAPDDSILNGGNVEPTGESINAQLLCAAHDAGIDAPASVTADALRHTYIAFLVRQGIRFVDLRSIVGELSRTELAKYSGLMAPASRAGGTLTRDYPLAA